MVLRVLLDLKVYLGHLLAKESKGLVDSPVVLVVKDLLVPLVLKVPWGLKVCKDLKVIMAARVQPDRRD
jgi:hypothetical protein